MATYHKQQGDEDARDSPPPPYTPDSPGYGGVDDHQLPSYENSMDPTAAPPSYDSIYRKVKKAKQDAGDNKMGFFKQFMIIICGTLTCTVCIGFIMAVPIAMIVIGAIYLDDCKIEPYIPIYLIVGGSFGVLKSLSSVAQRVINEKQGKEEDNAKTNPFDGIINCFLFAWFIAGNVWIYRAYSTVSYTPQDPNYCDKTLYLFAFWITTSTYIILALTCCCICCAGLSALCIAD